MQNEVIGDLGKELDTLPHSAEEMPIDELSAAAQSTFRGQLGKKLKFIISRMVSTKFPGSFSLQTVRDYLSSRWHLGSGRQDGLLVMAVTNQPAARAGSEKEAKAFLDSTAARYFSMLGLALPPPGESSSQGSGASKMAQAAALAEFQKSKRSYHGQLLRLNAKELDLDLHEAEKQLQVQEELVQDLRSELDAWQFEHGDDYTSGIRAIFDTLKIRCYDSAWNWALQDIVFLFNGLKNNTLRVQDAACQEIALRTINRSERRVFETLKFWYQKLMIEFHPSQATLQYVEALLDGVDMHIDAAPVFHATPSSTAPRTIIDPSGAIKYVEVPRSLNGQGKGINKYRKAHATAHVSNGIDYEHDKYKLPNGAGKLNPNGCGINGSNKPPINGQWMKANLVDGHDRIETNGIVPNGKIQTPPKPTVHGSSQTPIANGLTDGSCYAECNGPSLNGSAGIHGNGSLGKKSIEDDSTRNLTNGSAASHCNGRVANGTKESETNRVLIKPSTDIGSNGSPSSNSFNASANGVLLNGLNKGQTNGCIEEDMSPALGRKAYMNGDVVRQSKRDVDAQTTALALQSPRINPRPRHEACNGGTDQDFMHLSTLEAGCWNANSALSLEYSKILASIATNGVSFQDKCALVTGAGWKSLGAKLIEGLVAGVAKVIVTTGSYNPETLGRFQQLYMKHGARGSSLVAAPFNQGSQRDINALVSYINDSSNGLGWDLDYIVPFAAISENGRSLGDLDSKTELAHRVMLTNTLRLIGSIKKAKSSRNIVCRPAQVILPFVLIMGLWETMVCTQNPNWASKDCLGSGIRRIGATISQFAGLSLAGPGEQA